MKQFTTFLAGMLLLVALGYVVGGAAPVFGQAITGTMVGTVSDASGAVVPGATITITNLGTSISSTTQSGTNGQYTAPSLVPGNYNVTANLHGFKTAISQNNIVNIEQTTRVDFVLTPGAVSQKVTVEGQSPLIGSTTSDLGMVIGSKEIEELPLNGRLFEQLVTIAPGTIQAGFGDFAENPSAAGSVSATQAVVNGLPWAGNNYMIDGIHDDEPLNAFISITPPLNAIQEFKVETGDPTAEYGTFGGAIVNLTIKSGTNVLHGGVFDYVRNDALNARDYFALTKSPYQSNQFGGELGGPILKNKLFFFADYQQLIQDVGQTYLITVPTINQRKGILNEGSQQPSYDPTTGQLFPACPGSATPGFCIPQNRIDPIAQAVANLYPLPNLPGLDSGTVNNYVTNTTNTENVPQFDAKVAWQMTDHDYIFARESLALRTLTSPSPGNVFMMGGPKANNLADNAVIGWDRTISSTKLNSARIGFNRYYTSDQANDYGINENNIIGLKNGNIPSLPYTSGLALFNIPGFYQTGDPGYTNAIRVANIFEYSDTFNWIVGQHSLKFGTDIQRVQSTLTNAQDDPRGVFNFDGNITSNNGAPGTGNGFASFLIGDPASVQRDFVNVIPGVRMLWWGIFAQDDYRVTPKLTLNLGLRWDMYSRPVEVKNNQSNFNTTTGFIDIADSSNPGPNVNTYFKNFGPRVGLAYSPDGGKTAFRAAYGASYFPDNFGATGGTLERNFPFFTITSLSNPTPYKPFYNLTTNGLPGHLDIPYTHGGTLTPPAGFGVFTVAKNFRQDMAQVYNVSIQRQLPGQIAFTAAYVGTHGTRLYRDLQINQTVPGDLNVTDLPFYKIAPNITTVDQRNSDGGSSYNSGQFSLQKQTGNGLTLTVAYTWSKSIDDTQNILSPFINKLNQQISAGFTQVDIPQTLVISYTYQLPFGHGREWLSGSTPGLGRFVSGWQVSGITTYVPTGAPVPVYVASSQLNNIQGGGNYPDRICQKVGTPHTVQEWFNTSCFAAPPPSTFGNNGIGDVRAPGNTNFDFSIVKATSLGGSRELNFETDFFNLFNTAHWGSPNNTFGASNFGTITSDALPPRYIQMALNFQF